MKNSLVLLSCLLLLSCSSAQKPVYFYTLGNPAEAISADRDGPLVLLTRLSVADYLKQSNLVMQTGPNELQFAKSHIWAENLTDSINREMISALNKTEGLQFIDGKDPRKPKALIHLEIDLQQFLPTHTGSVVASGRYWVTDLNTGDIQSRQFHLSDTLTNDGYSHAVSKMKALLVKLATDIRSSMGP